MTQPTVVHVQVPATTANIGPGFDCLGAALTRHNQFRFQGGRGVAGDAPPVVIKVIGAEADCVSQSADNLVYRAFVYLYQQLGQQPPPLNLEVTLGVPLARGLGSSATAIVAGLVGANLLAGSPYDTPELLKFAIALEGHPDNVAPAILGGCQLATFDQVSQEWLLCPIEWHPTIVPIVAIPEFELSTQAARQVLPPNCSYGDAIFNAAHLGLLIKGLESGKGEWLRVALQDCLHQPYRINLIPGFSAVSQGAIAAGAMGVVISGAGPTVLALSPVDQTELVVHQMADTWKISGIAADVQPLSIDQQGVQIQIEA